MAVYVFGEPGMLLVKVGVSNSLDVRRAGLQRDDRAAGADFLYVHRKASGLDERAIHRMLRPRFWVQGEWFICGADVAKAVVRHVRRRAERARLRAVRADARNTPQRVRQIMREVVKAGRAFTPTDDKQIREAWRKWEAAGGKRRRKPRLRK